MEVTTRPTACSARSADSRPEPGPQTSTSSVRMPCSCALRDTSSAATCAANGVDLREPLNPCAPADDQAIELPCASVMVIIVLLNEELTWATPDEMFLRSRRRTRVASLAIKILPEVNGEWSMVNGVGAIFTIHYSLFTELFLLAGNRLGRALAGPGIGVCALA